MGGALIILALLFSTLMMADIANRYVLLALLATLGTGVVGFTDDYLKLTRKNSRGLSPRGKLLGQLLVAFIVAVALYYQPRFSTDIAVPFVKTFHFELGPFYVPFAMLVIVCTSNAVNLTDGLDGLAIMPAVMVAGGLAVFAMVIGRVDYSRYLLYPYIPGAAELTIFCGALVGAGLGFLWWNAYPADVFMGDVGALALGAALGTVAIIVRQEIVLFIMGGVFVAETVSVMVQVLYFKWSGGKRVFRMAPLHHHYELSGWKESQVVVRFWIITMMLVLFGLSTLKLR